MDKQTKSQLDIKKEGKTTYEVSCHTLGFDKRR